MRERTTGGFRPCLRPSFPMLEWSRGVHAGMGCRRRQRRREHEVNDTVGIDHFCRWRARPPQTTHAGRSFRVFATPACGNCAPCPRWQRRRSKILLEVRPEKRNSTRKNSPLLFDASLKMSVPLVADRWLSSTRFTCSGRFLSRSVSPKPVFSFFFFYFRSGGEGFRGESIRRLSDSTKRSKLI